MHNNSKAILILLIILPCYTHTWEWPWHDLGVEAVRELTRGALKVVAAVGVVIHGPKAYNAAKDTISPPPEVRVQQAENKVRDCFQGHAADQDLTIHNYPTACRRHLIGFILARDAVETAGVDLETVPRPQDLIDEFQYYHRQS